MSKSENNLDDFICGLSWHNEKHFLVEPVKFPYCEHFACKPCLQEQYYGEDSSIVICNYCLLGVLTDEEKKSKLKTLYKFFPRKLKIWLKI